MAAGRWSSRAVWLFAGAAVGLTGLALLFQLPLAALSLIWFVCSFGSTFTTRSRALPAVGVFLLASLIGMGMTYLHLRPTIAAILADEKTQADATFRVALLLGTYALSTVVMSVVGAAFGARIRERWQGR